MLDAFDRKILNSLQQDASISAAQIGQEIGLSQPACYRRIQRLEADGFIKKRVALVDAEKVDLGTTVIALVKLTAHARANLDSFMTAMASIATVLECYTVLGDHDFFLKVVTRDIHDYERAFIRKVSAIDGVAEIKSLVVLSQIKHETALPIED